MRILVTGATGFLGGKTALRLCQDGHSVRATGRSEAAKSLKQRNIEFHKVSLDKENLSGLLENIDAVVHCAAKSSPWGSYKSFYASNVEATRRLCQAALAHKVKCFVHISTPGLYFNFQDRHNLKEEDIIVNNKTNFYIQTKYQAEQIVQEYVKLGLHAIILRPRAIFGPGDRALLPRLLSVGQERFIPQMRVDRGPLCDLTYVDNVVFAIRQALYSSVSSGSVYNITNDEPVYLLDVLKKVFESLNIPWRTRKIPYKLAVGYAYLLEKIYSYFLRGKEPPFTTYTISLLAKDMTLDIQKAKKELGYVAQVNMSDALTYSLQAYKNEHTT